jgi:hypothetical protein
MKKRILTGLFILGILFVNAQENEFAKTNTNENKQKYHAIGFNAGASTGLGLAYRYQYNKHSYQLALLPLMSSRNSFVNIGGRYAYNFRDDEKTAFFGYIGQSATFIKDDFSDDYALITGVGFGTEVNLNKAIALNFAVGLGNYFTVENEYSRAIKYTHNTISLTGEIGLVYKLN